MYKLVMTWDILPNREKEFLDFLMHDFTPTIQKLGIQPTDAWLTVYGDCPQMLAGGVMDTLGEVTLLLGTDDWRELEEKLQEYVTNYERKVSLAQGGFQL
jgi:hypothetical protein